MKASKKNLAEIALAATGVFLIVERLFLHLIHFNYEAMGIGWLDPILDHWEIGLAMVLIAMFSWSHS